jgi:spore germination cell wall hydrolase CwlJ-like protein
MSLATTFRRLSFVVVCLVLTACGVPSADRGGAAARIVGAAGRMDSSGLSRLGLAMGPGGRALAARFDPAPHADPWGRPAAWTTLNLGRPPSLPWGVISNTDAAAVNALLPTIDASFAPARPFYLKATGPERERAVLCLTQAVYYEAGLEPLEGQQAVAQTVINRVRHPNFPKSICGVVYQGSTVAMSCQFTFTCDGSLARKPVEPYWSRARAVAEAALNGFVAAPVGPATNYHADYVFPRWGPQMVKIVQLGAHIFYRLPGPAGAPAELTGQYAGNELRVSMAGPSLAAIAAARAGTPVGRVTLAQLLAQQADGPAPQVITAATAESMGRLASATGAMQAVQPGQVIGGRRVPSRDEIARINAQLPPFEAPDAAKQP